MPARQFFAVFRAAKTVEWKKQAQYFYEMCNVSAVAVGDPKYTEKLTDAYRNRFDPKPKQAPLSNEIAGAILTKIFGGAHG